MLQENEIIMIIFLFSIIHEIGFLSPYNSRWQRNINLMSPESLISWIRPLTYHKDLSFCIKISGYHSGKENIVLFYACMFKNLIGIIPETSTELCMLILYNLIDFKNMVLNYCKKPQFMFVSEILNARKKQEDCFEKVDIINDAMNLHKVILLNKI
ncbi:LOW QUALITY PROTEIN: hypothetical protein HZS_711 [Henneguya salminicola]|nr:LOW QUALITY PROTEIN: hypothetical protein HZS_711 [Henneguya salminicola]